MTETKITPSKYLPVHIANYFLLCDNFKDMTVMKLTKLVYFGYAWHLAIKEERLFSEKIEAWKHGPVVPSIYHEFKRFGFKTINEFAIYYDPETNTKEIETVDDEDQDLIKILSLIWAVYKDKNAYDLRDITHQNGSPWNKVYIQQGNIALEDEDIKERGEKAFIRYYGKS